MYPYDYDPCQERPILIIVLPVIGLILLAAMISSIATKAHILNSINSGDRLFVDCQPVTVVEVIQQTPVEANKWYCKTGD